jgi:hypothetical protein
MHLNNSGLQTLLSRSLLGLFLRKASQKFGLSSYSDGLDNFINSNKNLVQPYSKKFFFIHNELPHPPYPSKDCLINYSEGYTDWGTAQDYSNSVSCALEKAQLIITQIAEKDPNAIFVVQGDHGTSIDYDWSADPLMMKRDELLERFSIFNSIKLPSRCKYPESSALGNIETINLVYNCIASNNKDIKLRNMSFAAVYEENIDLYGKLLDVSQNLRN